MPQQNPTVIVGIGLVSAVGVSTAETAAAVRAGTMRLTASHFHDKRFAPIVLAEVPDDGLLLLDEKAGTSVGLSSREVRLLRLSITAFRECIAPLAGAGAPYRVCLALPETETTRPLDRSGFLQHLAVQLRDLIDVHGSDASHRGRAGGILAVGQAALAIQNGLAEFVIAGGVDTFRDPYVLGTLDLEQRLKSELNLDGFIPGEGAGFLLLTSAAVAQARGFVPLARLSEAARGFEPGHLYSSVPYRGEGLPTTIAQLSRLGVDEPIGEVYSSMNGESHWAKEWGISYLRNRSLFRPTYGTHHPADCYGDTGAAAGPLMIGVASLGIRGHYRTGPALIYGSSDGGERAAVIVSSASH